jgi:hypothetical protein
MPTPRRPHVTSPDEVRFIRNGDVLVVEYADSNVGTTHFRVGRETLAALSDDELLPYWNDFLRAQKEHRESLDYVAREIPLGKPQVRYSPESNQWVPRGHVLRCVWGEYHEDEPEEPCVMIDGRDFTLAEFGKMLTTFAGWGMRIEFVDYDELHERPQLKVQDAGEE